MPTPTVVAPTAVRSQLQRVLESPGFANSPRLARLLQYLVEEKLAGRADSLKEYSVGLEVFDRPSSFDPKTDSIVRASARKLRAKLGEYYQTAGASDPVIIEIPKGAYVAEFHALVPARPARPWWPYAAAAALILVAWNAVGWRTAPPAHPSVAVWDVANASGNPNDAWLSTALAEMITQDLSSNEGLLTVSTEQVAQVRRDSPESAAAAQLRRSGQDLQDRLGAHYVILADFHAAAGGSSPALQVNTRLDRLSDGQTVLRTSDRGSEAQLYTLSAQIARKVRLALGTPRGDAASRTGPDRDSMRLYAEAVVKLRDSDPLAARALLEKSASADPSNFLAHALLADTYYSLGMEAQARIEGQAALSLAPPLAPLERLALEARCQGAMRDFPAAIESYRKLWSISPEVSEYGFQVAEFQEKASRLTDTLETLQSMRRARLSALDAARADFAEASIRSRQGEYQKSLLLVRQCARTAQRLGARYLYARARLREGGILLNLEDQHLALQALDDGLAICRQEGYRSCELNALRQEGNYFATLDAARAMQLYGHGAEIARQIGNWRGLVELLRGMAFVKANLLLDKEAEQSQRDLVRFIQEEHLEDKETEEVDLGELLVAEGRLDEAARFLRQVPPHGQEFSWNLCMADLERSLGNRDAAARRAEAQLEIARKTEDKFVISLALIVLSDIYREQGQLHQAETAARELERLRPFDVMGPYLLAELALAQENWIEAERQAAEAGKRLSGVSRPMEAAVAIVRAEALAGAAQPADALRVLDSIAPVLDPSSRAPLQLRARIARSRAQALLGACPAGPQYQDLLASARQLAIPTLVDAVQRTGLLLRTKCGTPLYAARRDAR